MISSYSNSLNCFEDPGLSKLYYDFDASDISENSIQIDDLHY